MSFINKLFGSSDEVNSEENKMNWIALEEIEQLDDIIAESNGKTIVIFKHSTRCSISRMALKQFEREFDLEGKVIPYFLDLLEFRPISNEIASVFGVIHQSPQIIVIKNGVSVYDASHSDIQAEDLKVYL